MTEKLKALINEYGPVAFVIYFFIFGIVILGFFFAILWGFKEADVDTGSVGTLGALGAAWLATKLTQPVRIIATLALTPIVGMAIRKRKETTETVTVKETPEEEIN